MILHIHGQAWQLQSAALLPKVVILLQQTTTKCSKTESSQPPPEAPLAGFILAQRVRSNGWPELVR